MLLRDIQDYADAASCGMDIGIAVRSIETGEEIAVSYDVAADINEYGELIFTIAIEP